MTNQLSQQRWESDVFKYFIPVFRFITSVNCKSLVFRRIWQLLKDCPCKQNVEHSQTKLNMLSYSVCMCLENRFWPWFDSVTVITFFFYIRSSQRDLFTRETLAWNGLMLVQIHASVGNIWIKRMAYHLVILSVCGVGVKSFCFFRFFVKKKISLIFFKLEF